MTEFKIGDKVTILKGDGRINTTITGDFEHNGRKYYMTKATRNMGLPSAEIQK